MESKSIQYRVKIPSCALFIEIVFDWCAKKTKIVTLCEWLQERERSKHVVKINCCKLTTRHKIQVENYSLLRRFYVIWIYSNSNSWWLRKNFDRWSTKSPNDVGSFTNMSCFDKQSLQVVTMEELRKLMPGGLIYSIIFHFKLAVLSNVYLDCLECLFIHSILSKEETAKSPKMMKSRESSFFTWMNLRE